MTKSPEYKRTLFDTLGPEAGDLIKVAGWMGIPLTAGAGIGIALAVKAGMTPVAIVLSGLVGAVLTGSSAALFVLSVSRIAGAAIGFLVLPSGDQTPYERQYSYEDSLVIRGDVQGALASYEQIIADAPAEAQPRLRAAELCLKSGMKEKAESFFRDVQGLPQLAPKHDVYASNRLVDLYLTWQGNEANALRELRRLIDTYPNTDVAARARDGLATLKAQVAERS